MQCKCKCKYGMRIVSSVKKNKIESYAKKKSKRGQNWSQTSTTSKQIKSNNITYNHCEESGVQEYHQNGSYNNWIVELYLSCDNQVMICPWNKKSKKYKNLNNLLRELSSPQNDLSKHHLKKQIILNYVQVQK